MSARLGWASPGANLPLLSPVPRWSTAPLSPVPSVSLGVLREGSGRPQKQRIRGRGGGGQRGRCSVTYLTAGLPLYPLLAMAGLGTFSRPLLLSSFEGNCVGLGTDPFALEPLYPKMRDAGRPGSVCCLLATTGMEDGKNGGREGAEELCQG